MSNSEVRDNQFDSMEEKEVPTEYTDIEANNIKKKRRKQVLVDSATINAAKRRGVCYLSRIPRHMDHVKLRHILSHYGEIERIYLVPENDSAHVNRKRAGGYRGTEFSEGWVEFARKSVAKRVAKLLNGEQLGGKKRSSFYYDLWNIKYLRKFKWDDLTEEIAYKNAIREQKLALEISAAKRERDFYLSKVEQSCALKSIMERVKKRQKTGGAYSNTEDSENKMEAKVIQQFPQNRSVGTSTGAARKKAGLSKEILAGVFARSAASSTSTATSS